MSHKARVWSTQELDEMERLFLDERMPLDEIGQQFGAWRGLVTKIFTKRGTFVRFFKQVDLTGMIARGDTMLQMSNALMIDVQELRRQMDLCGLKTARGKVLTTTLETKAPKPPPLPPKPTIDDNRIAKAKEYLSRGFKRQAVAAMTGLPYRVVDQVRAS